MTCLLFFVHLYSLLFISLSHAGVRRGRGGAGLSAPGSRHDQEPGNMFYNNINEGHTAAQSGPRAMASPAPCHIRVLYVP